MKVYLGKYIHFWTTQDAERAWFEFRYKKYDWQVEEKDRDWLDRAVVGFLDLWQKTVCRLVNNTWGKRPAIRYVKIDRWDDWNADYTLALIIHPLLKRLKEEKHGAPFVDDADVPEHLRSTAAAPKENEWDTDEFHFARWDWVLDEMIWTFAQLVDQDAENQFYSGDSDHYLQGILQDGTKVGEPFKFGDKPDDLTGVELYEMVKGPNDTFTIDSEGLKAYHARIDNGLRLFGRYYRALWT